MTLDGFEQLVRFGDDLIEFGETIKNPDATLRDLVRAADKCGVDFGFRFRDMITGDVVSDDGGCSH